MPRSIYQIRFFLQQPSPIWKDFSIINIKITSQTITSKDVREKSEANFSHRYQCRSIQGITF